MRSNIRVSGLTGALIIVKMSIIFLELLEGFVSANNNILSKCYIFCSSSVQQIGNHLGFEKVFQFLIRCFQPIYSIPVLQKSFAGSI